MQLLLIALILQLHSQQFFLFFLIKSMAKPRESRLK